MGHNEIQDHQFLLDRELDPQPAPAALTRQAARLRTYHALVAAFSNPPENGHAGNAPTPVADREMAKFANYPYAETLKRMQEFRSRLEYLCDQSRERGITVVFSTVIWNMISPPFMSTRPATCSDEDWTQVAKILNKAARQWPAELAALDPRVKLLQRPHRWFWDVERASGQHTPPAARPMSGRLGERGACWPPIERWSPRMRKYMEQITGFWERRCSAETRAELVALEAQLEEADRLCPELPETLFRLAVVQWMLGRDEQLVADRLDRAAYFDRAPRKGSRHTNDIVRSLASARGLPLYDAERVWQGRFPAGLIGWEVMADYCHMHANAYEVLMADLAEFLVPTLENLENPETLGEPR